MATKKNPKKSSIEDRFKDILDIDTPTIITLYGRAGTGKTTIACTGPKPLLLIDVKDKGTDSGKRPNTERGDIIVFSLESFDEIYEIYDYLQDHPSQFKSVVIDHMTALQELSHLKVQEEEEKEHMSQQMFGISSGYLGADDGDGICHHYDRVRLQSCAEGNAFKTASGVLYNE